ncbi:hypothetical protein Q9L58_001167 [Maublancomyces gigas]|uniref:3'-phosphate/5'-hydroxy nucleic acid ligase n=1 Tax=Discina gigas TaxID=1032678 RepID=A0ABR3GVM8_9PEZI
MPSTRLTLVLNTSQNLRCPLLLSSSSPDCKVAIFTTAKSKLRLKKPSRVFLPGGHELHTSVDILAVLKKDLTLLISAGEDYVGAVSAVHSPSTSAATGSDTAATVHTVTSELSLDPQSITQLETCARLPGMISAVGLPDLHPGTKFPIGCTFVSDGYIHPPLIGGDIGCGMSWYRTTLKSQKLEDASSVKRVAETLRGVEGEWMGTSEREWWLSCSSDQDAASEETKSLSVGEEWDRYLGTIGSGNHFAEIQVVEEIIPYTYPPEFGGNVYTPPFTAGEVLLLVHSGSRGYGQHVLSQFYNPTSDSASDSAISIPADDPKAHAYLALHDGACAWARRNRDLIALRFLHCLEGAAWESPSPHSHSSIRALNAAVQTRKVLDIHHNNVTTTPWPPSPADSPAVPQKQVYIHRKGAAPSTPLIPFLPLPGSRGTPTLMLRPLFTPATGHGAVNALSLAHGAGRAMSRAKARVGIARKYNNDTDVLTSMKPFSRGNSSGGGKSGKGSVLKGAGWVVCDDKELVWEEAPEAYKDVEMVGEDMRRCGVAEVVGRCVPRVTYKVRKE